MSWPRGRRCFACLRPAWLGSGRHGRKRAPRPRRSAPSSRTGYSWAARGPSKPSRACDRCCHGWPAMLRRRWKHWSRWASCMPCWSTTPALTNWLSSCVVAVNRHPTKPAPTPRPAPKNAGPASVPTSCVHVSCERKAPSAAPSACLPMPCKRCPNPHPRHCACAGGARMPSCWSRPANSSLRRGAIKKPLHWPMPPRRRRGCAPSCARRWPRPCTSPGKSNTRGSGARPHWPWHANLATRARSRWRIASKASPSRTRTWPKTTRPPKRPHGARWSSPAKPAPRATRSAPPPTWPTWPCAAATSRKRWPTPNRPCRWPAPCTTRARSRWRWPTPASPTSCSAKRILACAWRRPRWPSTSVLAPRPRWPPPRKSWATT